MYVCILYVCTYVCLYVSMYLCIYACMYACFFVCNYIYMHVPLKEFGCSLWRNMEILEIHELRYFP